MKAPAFQFYPADWQRDLSEHPLEIEGAWIRICCALWWSETPGLATKPLTNWARVLRVGERKCFSIITYLHNQNIADVVIQDSTITISSRRMVKDEYIRNIRRSAGSRGGNPSLKRREKTPVLDNQSLLNQNGEQKPTPSSSSSKKKENIKRKKSFETAEVILSGEFIEIAKQIGINGQVKSVFDSFRDHHVSKGNRFVDWTAAWRNWCRNQIEWGKVKPSQSGFLAAPWPEGGSR